MPILVCLVPSTHLFLEVMGHVSAQNAEFSSARLASKCLVFEIFPKPAFWAVLCNQLNTCNPAEAPVWDCARGNRQSSWQSSFQVRAGKCLSSGLAQEPHPGRCRAALCTLSFDFAVWVPISPECAQQPSLFCHSWHTQGPLPWAAHWNGDQNRAVELPEETRLSLQLALHSHCPVKGGARMALHALFSSFLFDRILKLLVLSLHLIFPVAHIALFDDLLNLFCHCSSFPSEIL